MLHVSPGTEAAAQLKLDRFNKETTIAQNNKAINLLKNDGILTEAQFIVGLENEAAETLGETFKMDRDRNPNMANQGMYAPWPFPGLFREWSDKAEIYSFEKCNVATPTTRPDAIERVELLDRAMNNDRRFYMRTTFLECRWICKETKRNYTPGCLKTLLKSGFERRFHDRRMAYRGPQTARNVDFGFETVPSPQTARSLPDEHHA